MPRPRPATLDENATRRRLLEDLPGWSLTDGWIHRVYRTDGWAHALLVANHIGFLAEAADHHPDLIIGWNRVEVRLRTHHVDGVTDKDFELAGRIETSTLWCPHAGSALDGPSKPWVEGPVGA